MILNQKIYKMKPNKILIILFFSGFFLQELYAQQNDMQVWTGAGLEIQMSEKFDLDIKGMTSFIPADNFDLNFAQATMALSYDIAPNWKIDIGDQVNIIPASSRMVRNRIYTRGTYEFKFSEQFKSTHALQVEFHSANEIRYSERFILINSITTRHRLTALKLRPSISYWLYYNVGGDPIQYYDVNGDKMVSQSANGFHRGRLYLSLNSKISDHFRLGAYFMNQREFNFLTPEYRDINVLNPNSGNIARDFNNYNVAGLSLTFGIGNE